MKWIFIWIQKNIGELRKQLDSSWYNDLTGEVYFYKGDPDGDFELNPMIDIFIVMYCYKFYNELFWIFPPLNTKFPDPWDENDFDENGNKTDH